MSATLAKAIWQPIFDEPYGSVVEPLEVWKALLEHLVVRRKALIRGSPQTGKTSLLWRGAYYSTFGSTFADGHKNPLADYKVFIPKRFEPVSVATNFIQKPIPGKKKIVALDEAHIFFSDPVWQPVLQSLLKEPSDCLTIFVSNTVLSEVGLANSAPAELANDQFWFFSPTEKQDSVRQWAARHLNAVPKHIMDPGSNRSLVAYGVQHVGKQHWAGLRGA